MWSNFSKSFELSQDVILLLFRHFIPSDEHHAQSWIFLKILDFRDEIPKKESQISPNFRWNNHSFFEVIASADIRFCAHDSAISKQTHTINIRNHYPIIRINEHFHKPLIDIIWMKFTQIHKIGENHQSFNMMSVTCFQYFLMVLSIGAIPVVPS